MKKYADDFKVVITEDKKGREKKEAVYAGKFFDVTIDEKELIKFRRISLVLLALILIIHVAGGCVANQGMYAFFVAVPYIFAFLPLYFMTTGILRLPKTKRKYRRDEIGLSFKRVRKSSTALFILLCLGVVGEIVYLIWFAEGEYILEWIYLAVEVVAVAIAYFQVHIQKSIDVIPLDEELQGQGTSAIS
jgi:hypothetical protein